MCHEKTRVMKNSYMVSWKEQNVPMRIAINMYVNNVMNNAMALFMTLLTYIFMAIRIRE